MCVFFVLYIEYFPYCLFVSNSQVIGREDPLRNDLYCFGWGLNSTQLQLPFPLLPVPCRPSLPLSLLPMGHVP